MTLSFKVTVWSVDIQTHTHHTDCSVWTTELISKQGTETADSMNLDNKIDVVCDLLNAMKTGNKRHRDPAVFVHLAPQKEIPLQILLAEVIFSTHGM